MCRFERFCCNFPKMWTSCFEIENDKEKSSVSVTDQPIISTSDIYHVVYHPLSRLIYFLYGDKGGCSRSGAKEFFIKYDLTLSAYICKQTFHNEVKNGRIKVDHRGVPYYISSYRISDSTCQEVLLNWRTLNLPNLRSSIELIKEEHEQLSSLIHPTHISNSYNNQDESYYCGVIPSHMWEGVSSVIGHVIGLNSSSLPITPSTLDILTSLPHLRSYSINSIGFGTDNGDESSRDVLESWLSSKKGGLKHLIVDSSYLELESRFFSHHLSNCTNLISLTFQHHSKGFFPNQQVSMLSQLNELSFSVVNFPGFGCLFSNYCLLLDPLENKIPNWIFNFTRLTTLLLHNCGLKDEIPVKLSKLVHLRWLDLTLNSFSGFFSFLFFFKEQILGDLASEICNLPFIVSIHVGSGVFVGLDL